MIVITAPDNGLILFHQITHAQMAGQIARAWQCPNYVAPALWERLVLATIHHDDGWLNHDQHPTLDEQGRPHDFKFMPMHMHREIWRRSITMAMGRDWLAGLLTSLYAKDLYVSYGRHGDADQEFINELSEMASRIIQDILKRHDAESKIVEPGNLAILMSLFTFWDGLSLTLMGALPWQPDWQYADGRSMLHVKKDAPNLFSVSPCPLSEPTLPIQVHGFELADSNWEDDESFQHAYKHAQPVVITVQLH
jgi:hypothetical protein